MKMRESVTIKQILLTVSLIFLGLGVFLELPYGFYTLLRFVVCTTGAYLGWLAYQKQKWGWFVTMAFLAILFNPLAKVHFERELWAVLDLIAGGVLLGSVWGLKE